jgi:hypothetical protein
MPRHPGGFGGGFDSDAVKTSPRRPVRRAIDRLKASVMTMLSRTCRRE